MSISVLTPYGTGQGLMTWTLLPEIELAGPSRSEKLIERAQSLLQVYGPYDGGRVNFITLITDLVYYTAESMHFWSQNVKAIVSPMKSERIGGYAYDKGSGSSQRELIEDNDIIWPLILHLQDHSTPMAIGTRVFQVIDHNPETGVRDAVDSYSNRTQRAIKVRGLVSDTEDFNRIVYGDPALGWDIQ